MERLRDSVNSPFAAPAIAGGGALVLGATLGLFAYVMRGNDKIWKPLVISATVMGVCSVPAAACAYKIFSGGPSAKESSSTASTGALPSHKVAGSSIPEKSSEASSAEQTVSTEVKVFCKHASATIQMTGRAWTRWENASPEDLRAAVRTLQTVYGGYEDSRPSQGYTVEFLDGDVPSICLQCRGGARMGGGDLSGVPADAAAYRTKCLFCLENKRVKPLKTFDDGAYTLISLSGQLMVIPQEHYAHWFKAPEDTRVSLLQQAYAERQAKRKPTKKPVTLHCGSAGYQTQFHLHVRTNILR